MEIAPTHYAASRAASVAENCINYQQGTPHKVFMVQTVQQASKEDIPGRGHKYHLKFSVEEIIQKVSEQSCLEYTWALGAAAHRDWPEPPRLPGDCRVNCAALRATPTGQCGPPELFLSVQLFRKVCISVQINYP